MSYSHTVVCLQMVECGAKERFLSEKFCRSSKFWKPAFVADHDKPKSNCPRIVSRPGVEGADRDPAPIVEEAKVFLLEVSYGQPSLAILSNDIDQHQRRLHSKYGCL
jgi:hypothetical protein